MPNNTNTIDIWVVFNDPESEGYAPYNPVVFMGSEVRGNGFEFRDLEGHPCKEEIIGIARLVGRASDSSASLWRSDIFPVNREWWDGCEPVDNGKWRG